MASIEVETIRPERGDLKFRVALEHANDAEVRADGDGAGEELLHVLGPGVGSDVVVVRGDAAQAVAHATAGVERPKARVLQPPHDGARGRFEWGRCSQATGPVARRPA